ncbi:MAG: DnaB-like helicase C-terminal domain-containing protein [Bacteroidales bacterium]
MKQDILQHIMSVINNQGLDEAEIMHQIKRLVYEYEMKDINIKESKSIFDLAKENLKTLQSETLSPDLIKTGFTDLDLAIGGLSLGEFVVIGGRPSMGKTQFLVSLALNVSIEAPILYFTFDLSQRLLTYRFISALTGVAVNKIIQNSLNPLDKTRLLHAEKELEKHRILVNDSSNCSISALKSQCLKHIQEDGIKIIMVDFLQMMSSNRYRNSRDLEIGYISRELKNIAKDNNVCVIASSQLSRAVESRGGNKRPQLSDLRESGAIEQDADKVIFIHRPEYYGFQEDEEGNNITGVAEVLIAKNRNGRVDDIKLMVDKDFTKFKDFELVKREFSISSYRLDEIDNSPL